MMFTTVAAGQTALRTPDGQPDLQGVWDFRTMTPLQRPEDQERAFLSEEEAAAAEAAANARRAALLEPSEVRTELLPAGGTGAERGRRVGGYNDFWLDYGTNIIEDRRTSLIVDPPDGRLPALTPEGERLRQVGSLAEDLPIPRPVRVRSAGTGAADPEDRGLAERCLVGFNSGPPMMPSGYNNNMQLFQTPDHVVILNEMVHDARIIPLDGRPHLPESVRQWMGDSRGRWEGDTLVVETTNLTELTGSFDPSAMQAIGTGLTVTLTERFTRVDENTLLYEYTVDDSDHLHAALHRGGSDAAERRADVRVRLPRRELRPAEHPERRPGRGGRAAVARQSTPAAPLAAQPSLARSLRRMRCGLLGTDQTVSARRRARSVTRSAQAARESSFSPGCASSPTTAAARAGARSASSRTRRRTKGAPSPALRANRSQSPRRSSSSVVRRATRIAKLGDRSGQATVESKSYSGASSTPPSRCSRL